MVDKQLQSTFKFTGYKISTVSLEPIFNNCDDKRDSISIEINIQVNEVLDSAIVQLDFSIFNLDSEEHFPYTVKLTMLGYFEIEGETTEENIIKFCTINGTAIMFPYIRSAVTDITKISNITPLILPTINIHKLMEVKERNSE